MFVLYIFSNLLGALSIFEMDMASTKTYVLLLLLLLLLLFLLLLTTTKKYYYYYHYYYYYYYYYYYMQKTEYRRVARAVHERVDHKFVLQTGSERRVEKSGEMN